MAHTRTEIPGESTPIFPPSSPDLAPRYAALADRAPSAAFEEHPTRAGRRRPPHIRATDTRSPDPLAPPPYAHETAEPSVPTEGAEGVEGVEGAEDAEGAEGIEGTEGIELVVVTSVTKPSSRVAA